MREIFTQHTHKEQVAAEFIKAAESFNVHVFKESF